MDEAIKESDLVKLDGSIDKLIQNLTELNNAYGSAVESVKRGATSITNSLRSASGATKEGRKAIDDASVAADRLEKAQKELAFAMSETGKQVAWLKAQTVDFNKATVEQQRRIAALTSYHTSLKAEIEDLTGLYKSLTKAEALDIEYGGKVAAEIRVKAAELKKLNDALRPHIEQLSRLQKAEQELAYLQSEEGQALLEVRKKIKEVTSSRKEEEAVIDPLTAAKQKLAALERGEKDAIIATNVEIQKKQKLLKLEQEELLAAENSYEAYAIANAKAVAEAKRIDVTLPGNAQRFEELKKEIAITGAQMRKFHEELGIAGADMSFKYGFTGLSNSVQQIVRELPAATISLNTFFLAISNNVPIFTDELKRAKIAYDAQVEAINRTAKSAKEASVEIGKLQKPITQVIKSLFSWQTALVIVLTILPKYGEAILKWIGNLLAGENAAKSFSRALKAVNEELKTNAHGYDDNMVTVRKLQREWKTLKTEAEKTKWIKDNESAWSKLDVAMTSVADAEDLFVRNTTAVQRAFMLRAKAAAAEELAKEKYAELLKLEVQREKIESEGPKASTASNILAAGGSPTIGHSGGAGAVSVQKNAQITYDASLKYVDKQIDAINSEIDAYFKLGDAARSASDEILGLHAKRDKAGRESFFDLEDHIANMRIKISESADKEQVKSMRDSFRQREKESIKEYNSEVNRLTEIRRENQKILDLRLKDEKSLTTKEKKILKELTPERIAILEEENEKVVALLAKFKVAYDQIIADILTEEKIARINTEKEMLDYRLEFAQEGSDEELSLRLQTIELEKQAALLANEMVADAEKKNVNEIIEYYRKLAREARGATALSDSRATRTISTANLIRTAEQGRGKPRRQARRVVGAEGSLRREVYEIDTQLLDINKQLELYYSNQLNLSKEQVAQLKLQKVELENQKFELAGEDGKVSGFENFMHSINENGSAGGLLEALGLDEEGIEAFNVAVDAVIDGLSQIIEAEIEAAEQAVEAAQERVSAAQAAYDAEIEARNNGYANSVDTARKELENEKRNEDEKQKMLEQARKKQQALDAATQASSLVTAVAGLWASYSTMGPASIVLAGIATAALFASFVASQVKAAQVAKQTYGEGGLEFLEGGSHASGNDIPLGTVNSEGKSMVAEGGEAMAIINKRNTKRYKRILPDIVDSLNKGTFEEKFLNAFNSGTTLDFYTNRTDNIDLSRLEGDVRRIREQGDSQLHTLPDGTRIVYYKNIKRTIKS